MCYAPGSMATDPTALRVAVLSEIVRAMGESLPPGAREATRLRLLARRRQLAFELDADPETRDELFREFDALFGPFQV